jgi:hypothetical protein
MTSTMTWISGSFTSSIGSVVSFSRGTSSLRTVAMSRTAIRRTSSGTPRRPSMAEAFSFSSWRSPVPTTPQPTSPIPIDLVI